ncbi:DUF115 domain-containing protein [bacterium]|nr:DUF115 domain-containing protein [bacterium]MBU0899628.1 DUF115 domain-containing protein [bacterium]MBU1153366.1 DUF115 domain-containing protein [bacterium]
MNYYLQNINLLKNKDPELATRLEDLSFSKGKIFISEDLSMKDEDCDVLVIFGFGNGSQVKEAIKHASKKTLVLVIDHDIANFKNILTLYDLKDIFNHERVSLAIGEEPLKATRIRMENYFQVITIKDIIVIDLYKNQVNPAYYQEIIKHLNESINASLQNIATMSEFASLWEKNILANISYLVLNPGLNLLKDSFKDFPAIIVSAGPSLDKNVGLLSEAKNKSLIICVDTALKTLLAHNIKPEIVVSIDPKEENFKHYQGSGIEGITLITEPVVSSQIFSLFKENLIFITSYGHPLMMWIEDIIGSKGTFPVGGSVATTAFSIARELGNNPIIFIGQDLSYSKDGVYSKNTFYMDNWINSMDKFLTLETITRNYLQEYNLIYVKGNYEEKVLTNSQMASWAKWFSHQFKNTKSLCINATEGGAKIENCVTMSLKEAINNYCQQIQDPKNILQDLHRRYKTPDIDNLIKKIKKVSDDYLLAEYYAQQAIETTKRLEKTSQNLLSQKDNFSQRELNLLQHINMLYGELKVMENVLMISRWHLDPLLIKLNSIRDSSLGGQIEIYNLFFQKILSISQNINSQFLKATEILQNIVVINENLT